jgi:hypothetical protein
MRKNDPVHLKKRFFRSDDRFFQINGQWHFSAREGDIGPFRSREQARLEADAYVAARRASEMAQPRRAGARDRAEHRVIPGYLYRSVLSMAPRASADHGLVLNLDDLD